MDDVIGWKWWVEESVSHLKFVVVGNMRNFFLHRKCRELEKSFGMFDFQGRKCMCVCVCVYVIMPCYYVDIF